MSSNDNSHSNIPVLGIITIIFVIAKIVPGNIVNDWSWWIVFSPILLPIAVIIIIFAVVMLYEFIMNFGK